MKPPLGHLIRRTLAVLFIGCLSVVNFRLYSRPTAGLDATLRFLDLAQQRGAAERMQEIYPEGFVFYHALTALAWSQANGRPGRTVVLDRARRALDSDAAKAPQSAALHPAHGIFYRGWVAWVRANELAITPPEHRDPDRILEFEARCEAIARAFADSDSPFLEAYPGLAWPCDSVVAIAALRLHDRLLRPRYGDLIDHWLAQATGRLDPATGLLPHSVTPDGQPSEGARGSSQSLLLPFLMTIDPGLGQAHYARFRAQFATRLGGLATVREYPRGQASGSDIDSGPVIFGSSPVATVVTVAAARMAGDAAWARALCQTQEALLMPLTSAGQKRYLGGVMPAMDGFIAWSRTMPVGPGEWPPVAPRESRWPLHLLSLGLAVTLWTSQTRSFRRALTSAPSAG